MIQINARQIYTPQRISSQPKIAIKHGSIISLGKNADGDSLQLYDLPEYIIVPGFIEMQINGAFGIDFTNEPARIWEVGERLTKLGITTFLPTIITSPMSAIQQAMQTWQAGAPQGYSGAHIPGFHIEGPFLNPQKKGAHRIEFFRKPMATEVIDWSPENGIRMVTLAPELPGAFELILLLNNRGVIVSAGHSMASSEQLAKAQEVGLMAGTHLFNAMRPLEHRSSSLIAALLTDDRLKVGLIVDGIHLAPEIVKIVYRCKGTDNIFLVSDAMAALGLSPGNYQLAGRTVAVDENSAHLEDGTLAGSILTPTESLRNFEAYSGCSLEEALACWTTTPATMLKSSTTGKLQIDSPADLVALDDHGRVAGTMIAGEWVFIAPWANISAERIR